MAVPTRRALWKYHEWADKKPHADYSDIWSDSHVWVLEREQDSLGICIATDAVHVTVAFRLALWGRQNLGWPAIPPWVVTAHVATAHGYLVGDGSTMSRNWIPPCPGVPVGVKPDSSGSITSGIDWSNKGSFEGVTSNSVCLVADSFDTVFPSTFHPLRCCH